MTGRIAYLSLSYIMTLLVAFSCSSTQQAFDSKDLSYLYNPNRNLINPRYNINNLSDSRSDLSIKFFSTDLFFSEANPKGIPMASLLISVKLFNINQGRILADTLSYSVNIIREEEKSDYVYNFPLEVEKGVEYVVEIKTLDRIRQNVVQAFIPFNTLSEGNRYNFMLRGHFGKKELFTPVLSANEYINLVCLRNFPDSIFISFFKPFREIPYPPSLLLPEKTPDYDPQEVISLPYSDTLPMMFPNEGIYLFSTERDVRDGYTLVNLGVSYPEIITPEKMIEPLAYIASEEEMNNMRHADNPKVALDEFWMNCTGNVERARELIRIYYTRVLYSNYYFTSYKEGWRSERGMIYIMYGPPDKVYKTTDGERWGYRKPVLKSSWGGRYKMSDEYLFFNFRQRDILFSDNDYYLSRSESLVTYWDKAVTTWRSGMAFRLDNPEDI